MKRSAIVLFVLLCLAMQFLAACGGGVKRTPIGQLDRQAVTYQAEDGVRIVASWFLPPDKKRPAVVILLHPLQGNRAQWNPLIPVLVDEGYAVLAPDLRSFGESTVLIRDGKEEPYTLSDPKAMLLDVAAALKWLKGRSDVDQSRIGVIGANVGANIAYVSTGKFPEVKTAIAISPSPYSADDAILGSIPDFAAHDVFLMAGGIGHGGKPDPGGAKEWEEAVSLGIRISGEVKGQPYYGDKALRGVELLARDDVVNDILDWLAKHLGAKPASRIPPSSHIPAYL